MMKPSAHISVDLDTVDTHLAGYGVERAPCDLIYRTSVPRILELLDRFRLRATFFVIARDAESQAQLWREIVHRGHEVASHSVTHPLPFASLPPAEIERELWESRQRLEDITGQPVLGFRAPGWDVDRATLIAIARAGYRYDASVLPSPAALLGAGLRCFLSRGRARLRPSLRPLRLAFSPRRPYRLRHAGGLWEFPVAVSPLLRIPFTQTLWYLAPRPVCRAIQRSFRRRSVPLSYQFHAVDLLDLRRDGVDLRLRRHPGMQLAIERKRALLCEALAAITAAHAVTPYACALPPAVPGAGARLGYPYSPPVVAQSQ